MTWTYAGSPGSSTAAELRDAVRLYTGDNDSSDEQLSDEEIAFLLDNNDDNAILAAIDACRALQARYSRQASKTIGKLRIAASDRAKAYASMIDTLEAKAYEGTATADFGGQSISGKEALAADSDAIQPIFERGMDDFTSDAGTASVWDSED